MCYADGSLEQATSTCAMCKVFPRNNSPCTHKDTMGVCKNRANHPRHDVVHFRNAELSSFNGCGFCKWAKRHPKAMTADAAWKNPGWPGCCRPPRPSEYELINIADWYAISKIHNVPIPTLSTPGGSPPQSHVVTNKSPSGSPSSRSHAMPVTVTSASSLERRNSGSRETGIPGGAARDPSSTAKSDVDTGHRSSSDSPRKLDTLAPVRAPVVTREPPPCVSRSPTRPATHTGSPRKDERESDQGKSPSEEKDHDKALRTVTKTRTVDPAISTIRLPQHTPLHGDQAMPRPVNPAVPKSIASSSSSSSSSSGSYSSMTQSGTITSEGFTDYLSDESELEMQREAERRAGEAERAAKFERQKLEMGREEQEFRAARTQLASIGLQPPPAWSGRLPITINKTSQSSSSHTNISTASRPVRTPGNMYGTHPTTASSPYVQVYQFVRQ